MTDKKKWKRGSSEPVDGGFKILADFNLLLATYTVISARDAFIDNRRDRMTDLTFHRLVPSLEFLENNATEFDTFVEHGASKGRIRLIYFYATLNDEKSIEYRMRFGHTVF